MSFKIRSKKKVGILGFGALGQFLVKKILNDRHVAERFELAFIQNRTVDKIYNAGYDIEPYQILAADFDKAFESYINAGHHVDIIIECSHPDVVKNHGIRILSHASFYITSLTALADDNLRAALVQKSEDAGNDIIIPTGAGWGFEDIRRLSDRGMLRRMQIAMKFHVDALRVQGSVKEALDNYVSSDDVADKVLYEGSLRYLTTMAPNNVNTMCGLALAGRMNFDALSCQLIASKQSHQHEVKIEVHGPDGFVVRSHRINPALAGAVTGSMTFVSLLGTLMENA